MNLAETTATYYPTPVLHDPLELSRVYRSGEARYVCVVSHATKLAQVIPADTRFLERIERLLELRQKVDALPERSRRHGLEPPNGRAISSAKSVLSALVAFPIQPDRVVASAEGGVSVVFYNNGRRATIESLNTGEMMASVVDPSGPDPWVVTPDTIYAALSQIRGHLIDSAA